jgi:hypothetical protein
MMYSHNGQRNLKLLENAVFSVAGKALRPKANTLAAVGISTLMNLDATTRFLNGEEVSPNDWYKEIVLRLRQFTNLDFDPRLYDVVAAIIMGSYFYDVIEIFPILTIFGPFETGKGRLLHCVIYMGHRGMSNLDPTDASLYRTVEAWKPFLGIDEFYDFNKEIARLLRSVYKKGTKVPRMEKTKGGQFFLTLFETFSKVAIAGDKRPPRNILQKGIMITMKKMGDPHPEKRDPVPEDFEEIRTRGYIARLTWALNVREHLVELSKKTKLGLVDRDYEVWKAPLTIASMLGGDVWSNVLSYAKEARRDIQAESYEELKAVIEGIYTILVERSQLDEKFPFFFTPRDVHDLIWEKLKEDYRVTKERQERGGEAGEKYDYDTRSFERLYNTRRIGRTYFSQLSLKGKHTEQGTRYGFSTPDEFNEIVERYHPELKEKKNYRTFVLTPKIMSETSVMSATSNLNTKTGLSETDKIEDAKTANVSDTDNVSPTPNGLTLLLADKIKNDHSENVSSDLYSTSHLADITDKIDINFRSQGVTDLDDVENACLAQLGTIKGSFSEDYGLERIEKITKDHTRSELYLQKFLADGKVIRLLNNLMEVAKWTTA